MTVREGAALGVLPGEADVGALGQQRGEGERLGVAVLDRPLVEQLDPPHQRLAQLAVDREALGNLEQLLVQRAQPVLGDGGFDLGALGAVELAGADLGGGRVLVLARLHLRFSSLWIRCSSSRRSLPSASTSSGVTIPSFTSCSA